MRGAEWGRGSIANLQLILVPLALSKCTGVLALLLAVRFVLSCTSVLQGPAKIRPCATTVAVACNVL